MATVTRRDLARALKEEHGGSIADNDRWIQTFVDVLARKVSEAGRVEIRGFGAFSLSAIKAHTTVNPSAKVAAGKKRKKVKIAQSYTVDFRPSKLYKQRLKADQASKKRRQSVAKKEEPPK